MVIDSSRRPVPALNGDVMLSTSQGPGHYEELALEYEAWYQDKPAGYTVFTCHDPGSNTVTVRVRTTLLEEVLFGRAIAPFTSSEPSDWWDQGLPTE